MNRSIELLFADDCANVNATRDALRGALARVDLPTSWRELRIGADELPAHARGFGSPTVLVDGRDVAGATPEAGLSCRLYATEDGPSAGFPSVALIEQALRAAPLDPTPKWRSSLAVLPSIGVALLPKVVCPACWPAYAGVLGALGLGFLMETAYLLPLTTAFLVVALGALAFRAKRRRGFGPLFAGIAASTVLMIGKFVFDSDLAMYAGVAGLVAASIWNTWPRRRTLAATCCPATGSCNRVQEPLTP